MPLLFGGLYIYSKLFYFIHNDVKGHPISQLYIATSTVGAARLEQKSFQKRRQQKIQVDWDVRLYDWVIFKFQIQFQFQSLGII